MVKISVSQDPLEPRHRAKLIHPDHTRLHTRNQVENIIDNSTRLEIEGEIKTTETHLNESWTTESDLVE